MGWRPPAAPTESDEQLLAQLRAGALRAGIALPASAERGLVVYLRTLLLWRQSAALVSQRTGTEIIAKHVDDSLAIVPLVQPGWRLADLGSGAGFPGLVLAIVCPAAQVLLCESRRRKANFLRTVIREVRLENAQIVECRAEALGTDPNCGGLFNLVVSRAVWSWREFLQLAAPLLHPGGVAVAMKGPDEADLNGLRRVAPPGYSTVRTKSYVLRGGEQRTLVIADRCST